MGSFDKVSEAIKDSSMKEEVLKSSFASALSGIREGSMTYENDPLLPML